MSEEEKNHLSNSGLGDTWRAMKISSENAKKFIKNPN
jgi:hypothetical protein